MSRPTRIFATCLFTSGVFALAVPSSGCKHEGVRPGSPGIDRTTGRPDDQTTGRPDDRTTGQTGQTGALISGENW